MSRINPKHALTLEELQFCKVYLAFGEKNAAEAYRRAFHANEERDGPPPPPKECSKRAARLLAQDYITAYIEEIQKTVSDHARQALADQVMFGDDTVARRAAERIFEMEDKLGFRDAAEKWAEVMCAIGAEVVYPLDGGHEIAFPLKAMFPQYSEALPPESVLTKTIKSLQAYRAKVRGEEEPDADV